MGRDSSDSIVIHSSIVLLQERFRQLQRAKQMREERELLRMLSESERINPIAHYEASRLFFHSELILPSRPPLQSSPFLQTNPQSKHTDLHVIERPNFENLWSTDAVMQRTNVFHDVSDVDTSLHL